MSELLFQFPERSEELNFKTQNQNIRWLTVQDHPIFVRHLELCGQTPICEEKWEEIYRNGTIYCGIFENGNMVARACREVISPEQWEIADVRVVKEFRGKGYAFQICQFVLSHILSNNKIPTIRTEDANHPMLKVISKLGFKKF